MEGERSGRTESGFVQKSEGQAEGPGRRTRGGGGESSIALARASAIAAIWEKRRRAFRATHPPRAPSVGAPTASLPHRLQVARARQFLRAHAADAVSLGDVARAAGASRFHFSRLYFALTRETVFQYLTRLRLQKAARRLCEAPAATVSEIALGVGYETPSSFNKAFRRATGVSPSELRAASTRERRDLVARLATRVAEEPRPPLRLSRTPEMRRRPPRRYIHACELGPYPEVGPLAWSRLAAKLAAGRINLRAHELIGASYDDPRLVSEERLRYEAGIVVDAGVQAPPGTLASRLEGGDYAVFEHRGPYRFIAHAFSRIFGGWVLRSGARVRPAPCLEIYRNALADVPEHDLLTELLIPLETST